MRGAALVAALASLSLTACPGPKGPRAARVSPLTVPIGRDGASLRSIAADAGVSFAALVSTAEPRTTVEAYAGISRAWSSQLTGTGGPMAVHASTVAISLSGQGDLGAASSATRVTGEPGALVVGLDAKTGAPSWRLPIETNEWVVVAAMAATDDGFVLGGSFSGSLRISDRVVTAGAKSDGFVAKLTAAGELAWLVRMGGPGADAIQGVATRGPRIAIAGTFAAGADLLGTPLPAFDEKSPFADALVAELTPSGTAAWSKSFGGRQAETVAGVAIDAHGSVVIAASARDTVHVGGVDLVARGPADGLLAWWNPDGSPGHAILVGGTDFDGIRSIIATSDRVVVGGFYSGTIDLGDAQLTAGGGDGAFIATLDRRGTVVDAFDIEGAGREEIIALAAIPDGFVAGVAHTAAASITGDALPAPRDPLAGAALIVRGVR
ncbi:MAG: hypothetical protein SFX73_03535 [Kofleriaceae bacterium]|nr:hypothetical protein [Kofleriaceae bacterium]